MYRVRAPSCRRHRAGVTDCTSAVDRAAARAVRVKAPTAPATGVPEASGRLQRRLRQRRERLAPLALDPVPVLRDEARRKAARPAKPAAARRWPRARPRGRRRILLRDARVAALGRAGAAGREPARHAERRSHADKGQERPDAALRSRSRYPAAPADRHRGPITAARAGRAGRSGARTRARASSRSRGRPSRRWSRRRSVRTRRRAR